jgi:hypothetical protein
MAAVGVCADILPLPLLHLLSPPLLLLLLLQVH